MAERLVICPFCGLEFEKADSLCEHGCPLHASCHLVRCPGCDYEFPDRPRSLTWIGRLLASRRGEEPARCDSFRSLTSMAPGESARVVSLAGSPRRNNTLAVFGLVPGSELTLLQRLPVYVVEIGETQLALEAEVAAELFVERL